MVTKEQDNSYPEFAKSLSEEAGGPKECGGEEKEEGSANGGLDSTYKGRAPLPFFNLQQAHKSGPLGPRKLRHTL